MDSNKIYNIDCIEGLKQLPDNSIDLIITSPPYNKGYWSRNRNVNNGFKTKVRHISYGDFDDNLEHNDYVKQQTEFIKECLRVLKQDGSLFYNHKDILFDHKTIHPTYVYDFPLKQIIVWNQKNTPSLDKTYFYPINEYIYWLKKDKESKVYFDRKQAKHQKSIWEISRDTKNNHPAPFPEQLVENIILSASKENATILDPFMGSGTTALVAKRNKRNYIGFELNKDYCELAQKRIAGSE
jgi:modification methylase